MEARVPITIRLKPSLLKAARIAAAQAGVRFGDWLESAFKGAVGLPSNGKQAKR